MVSLWCSLYIIQVAAIGRQLPFDPKLAQNAKLLIGPSTVSDASFTSGDSNTFSERQRGRFFFPAADDASAVDYSKDMDDDSDGVVDSYLILPEPISAAPSSHIPLVTLDSKGCHGGSPSRNLVLEVPSDLARPKLTDTMPTTAARLTMSSGASSRRCAVKRYRRDAFGEGVETTSSKYRRIDEILATLKDHCGDSSSRPLSTS